jgi:hypothetical protein
MVETGWDCSFVSQTRNVQKHGGALAVMLASQDNANLTDYIVGDDGTGGGIRIPAVMITKEDGKKIIDWLGAASPSELAQVEIQADFMIDYYGNNEVNVELFYTSSDDYSMDFIRNMARYIEPMIEQVKFEPRAVTYQCRECEQSWKERNCLSDGRYCAMMHSSSLDITGE